ncbi:MAG: hypothetical protein ACLPPF_08060, partial [Rhodomicrobium sp.]
MALFALTFSHDLAPLLPMPNVRKTHGMHAVVGDVFARAILDGKAFAVPEDMPIPPSSRTSSPDCPARRLRLARFPILR